MLLLMNNMDYKILDYYLYNNMFVENFVSIVEQEIPKISVLLASLILLFLCLVHGKYHESGGLGNDEHSGGSA
jgi:hypothetical protein